MDNQKEIDDLIVRLGQLQDQFPMTEIKRILELKDDITPRLVSFVQEASAAASTLNHDQWQRFVISLYALAWFRDSAAFPAVVAICSLPKNDADNLLGDAIMKDLHKIIGATFNGDWASLRCIISDRSLNEFVRDEVLSAHMVLYKCGRIERGDLINYFRSLFSELHDDGLMITTLVHCCMCIHAAELKPEIMAAFAKRSIDKSIINIRTIKEAWANARTRSLEVFKEDDRFDLPTNPIEQLYWWPGHPNPNPNWTDDDEFAPDENQWRGVGRNDPCPCGSGKKFKKCHLNTTH